MIFYARATRGLEGPRWTRAVENQSACIPEGITSELGGVRLLRWRTVAYARSEGQSSHPLVSEPFAHEWEGGEEERTSHDVNLTAHPFHP